MKNLKIRISLIFTVLFLFAVTAFSQNAPITTAGSVTNATAGGAVVVPVTVTNFTGVGAITLRLYYNPTQLTFGSITNTNAALSANMTTNNVAVNATSAYIAVVWADINGATLTDGSKMFDINYTFNAGPASITFDNTGASGSNCEYASTIGDVLIDTPTATYYIDGTVSGGTALSSAKDILSFSLPQQTGAATINTTAHTVAIQVVSGTSLASLTPTISVSANATINPASGVAQDFTNPVTYTTTAQDASTQAWTVTVTVATTLSSAKDILTFTLPQQSGAATINTTAHTVAIQVVSGTALTALTPTITVSANATINPASGVAQDFTNPVTYTTTAQDASTQAWVVTVTVAAPITCNPLNAPMTTIGSASVATGSGVTLPVTVNCFNNIGAITLRMYYNPTLLTYGSVSNVNATLSANMTTNNVAVNATSAYIAVVWADINGATLADGSKLMDLNFTLNAGPATVSFDNTGAAGSNCEYASTIGDVLVDTPTGTYYFDGTVTATGGSSSANDILTFTLPQQTGAAVINATTHTVTVQVSSGTSLTALTPTITVSANATINPASGTTQNFTAPFSYTVTAQDATPQVWVVTVTAATAGSSANDILTFTLPQQTGAATINTTSHTVLIEVASGTSLASLTPTITVSANATINPGSGTAQNFATPFLYTVTAQDGTAQAWYVTVTVQGAVNMNAPTTVAATVSAPLNSQVAVPLTVNNFNGIGAITLRLYYNPTQLTYVSITNVNAALAANMTTNNIVVNATSAYIAIVWADINGASLPDGSTMLDMNFTFLVDNAVLTFDNTGAAGSNCEYANTVGDVLTDNPTASFYQNGLVHAPIAVELVDAVNAFKVSMYPNPVNSTLYFTVENSSVSSFKAEVFNVIGQLVVNRTIEVTEKSVQSIDMTGTPKGVYFVRLSSEKESVMMKIVKE